jgi:hypothetical protein
MLNTGARISWSLLNQDIVWYVTKNYKKRRITDLCTNVRSVWCHITGIILVSLANFMK